MYDFDDYLEVEQYPETACKSYTDSDRWAEFVDWAAEEYPYNTIGDGPA